MSDYIVHTPSDIKKMLKVCGKTRLDGLFSAVPSGLRAPALKIQRGKSQLEVEEIFREYAGKNKVYKTILRGAGAYSHYIPPVVRTLS
jgi:glycine dehydrogenase subunit 1